MTVVERFALLVGDAGVSEPAPSPTVVAPVAKSETLPVGAVQPAPLQVTPAAKATGEPWTTVAAWPLAKVRVAVEPAVLATAAQLFTRALASKEPKPLAKS